MEARSAVGPLALLDLEIGKFVRCHSVGHLCQRLLNGLGSVTP